MPTIFQQLGGYVDTAENLSDQTLSLFAAAGGGWIVPVLYGDTGSAPWNLANLDHVKTAAAAHGVKTGGWFNGWAHDPIEDAIAITDIVKTNGLALTVLDLEAAYQAPGGNPELMPVLVQEVHDRLLAGAPICVSTNGLNNSMIYNGRVLTPPQSFYDLGIRVAPQWYSAYYAQDGNTTPQARMKWLKEFGGSDFNFEDPDATKTGHRGVPLSYVHPTVEATGEEGSSLLTELGDLDAARAYGLTPGISIYTLENTPDADLDLLAKVRGRLFLPPR